MKKRIALITMCVVLLCSLILPSGAAVADYSANDGIYLGHNDYYKVDKDLAGEPNTLEAWVYLPAKYSTSRVGEIISNYAFRTECIGFGIFTNCHPKVLWVDSEGYTYDLIFDQVTLPVEEWVHLAIVRDLENRKVYCYVNGVLEGTIDFTVTNSNAATKQAYADAIAAGTDLPALGSVVVKKMIVGGDHRANNAQYFKGYIKSLALYSDIRTAEEINADMTTVGTEDLLLHYDFSDSVDRPELMTDLSGNGCDAHHSTLWMDSVESDFYSYSMAVVSDTQMVNHYNPENFHYIYDWIVDNVAEKNIQFVIGLGDITDASSQAEWQLAQENIFKMNGVVPYSIARGNHDALSINTYFNVDEYIAQVDGRYKNNGMQNTWRKLTVGDVKYLILTLDFGPLDDVLAWANEVIAAHPDYNVILVTHAYLGKNGAQLDSSNPEAEWSASTAGFNNGEEMWDELVSQHENIAMVLCGHISTDDVAVTQREGKNGHIVTEMLIDFQSTDLAVSGGCGIVTMFYFSEDGKTLRVENYSTIRDQYFKSNNQFTIHLDLIGDEDAFGSCGDDATFYFDSDTGVLTVSGAGEVTCGWADSAAKITSVVVESGITGIGANAFAGSTALTEISIPDSVTNIDSTAFTGCTSLTITCNADSAAESFAAANSINCAPIVAGDINGDGMVTLFDVQTAIKAVWTNTADANLDMNADGQVSMLDVLLIIQKVLA